MGSRVSSSPRWRSPRPRLSWLAATGVLLAASGVALAAGATHTAVPATPRPTLAAAWTTSGSDWGGGIGAAGAAGQAPALTPPPSPAPATATPDGGRPAPSTAQGASVAEAAEFATEPATQLATGTPTPPATAETTTELAAPTLGAVNITPQAGATLVTPIPTAVQPVAVARSVVNVLLIGTDIRATDNSFRTDTLIVASIDTGSGAVSLLSIPRDLYVYIPKWGMARINQAFQAGNRIGYPGGGPALLVQTILYNLGIPIHYYALANFDGFRQIVDTLGGIDVPVNCQLTEYKISDPALDERDAANYQLYTQPTGVAHMDGALALWYARARPVGGDFFRGYRQRQVLRAVYHQALDTNVIPRIPALYAEFHDVVESDMSLLDVMQFVPLAANLDDTRIRSLHIGPNQTSGWLTPAGEAVLLPRPGAIEALVAELFGAAAANRLERPLTWVEVVNGAAGTASAALAAETLRGEGFAVSFGPAPAEEYAATTLIDFTTSAKGSPVKRLQSVLHIPDASVVPQPDAASPVSFRLILGSDFNSCPRLDWMDPALSATPTPQP